MNVSRDMDKHTTTITITDHDIAEAKVGTALNIWLQLSELLLSKGNMEFIDATGEVCELVRISDNRVQVI